MTWPTTPPKDRGYGAEWTKTRARILERDAYLCQCRHCKAEKRITVATEVDHIKPKAQGGTDDDANLQAINRDCHARKNVEDQGKRSRERIGFDKNGWPKW